MMLNIEHRTPNTQHRPATTRKHEACRGQAIIESAVVIVVACLVFFGLVQLSRIHAAHTLTSYAASAGARSRMVGFNRFMVHKVVRVTMIPNAGRMTTPTPPAEADPGAWGRERPGDLWERRALRRSGLPPYHAIERARIPLYMGAENAAWASATLDYEHWPSIRHSIEEMGHVVLRMRVSQDFPLTLPFRGAFYADDFMTVRAGSPARNHAVTRERHYPVYLQ